MIARQWEPKIELSHIDHRAFPDTFKSKRDCLYPDPNFVISRTIDGRPLSRYKDDIWDFTSYRRALESSKFHFHDWLNSNNRLSKKIHLQAKEIFFCILYKSQISYSIGSLGQSWVALRTISTVAYRQRVALDRLTEEEYFSFLIKHLELTGTKASISNIRTLFVRLQQSGKSNIGYRIATSEQIKMLRKMAQRLPDPFQTTVIPQRLYLNIIEGMENLVHEFLDVSERLEELLRKASLCPLYGRRVPWQKRMLKKQTGRTKSALKLNEYNSISFTEACLIHGLDEWCDKLGVNNIVHVASSMKKVQTATKILIHTFTGMRKTEAQFLPYNCLKIKTLAGKKVFIIDGFTHKLSKGIKTASWISAKEVVAPIKAAQRICDIISRISNMKLSKDETTPLFPNTDLLPAGLRHGRSKEQVTARYPKIPIATFTFDGCMKILGESVYVTRQDIEELTQVDPHRDWKHGSSINIGERWPLASHQLRRSLAVYASNSGFVTLPSLKLQLKHIRQEMTLYYAANSSFSKMFVSEENNSHISEEFAEELLTANALRYLKDVVLTDSQLFGVYGTQLQKAKNLKANQVRILNDRDETISKFRNGDLAYRETLLGGCIETEPCSQGSFMTLTGCLSCASGVFSRSIDSDEKVRRAAEYVAFEVAHEENGTFEHDAAVKQLTDLKRIYKEITGTDLILEIGYERTY